ncbi:transcriptional regulator with XRE-family HTH domain [Thermocatellispora tengchongensis]|uniref:Transcriptional regulator with XRE-family HTH domain n=1 Tax=Thermocatellispora tengchongensis TaxID=1073253 RepID=A0A840PLQ8_9ACTN|nr:helix-turn-helix domain-containing protein [Thermocatellispora tengchongensis]MBB5138731.1 transcriptional regulator with XRE-family HTH domain [Thermocatellispora tengchongensis]
MDRDNALGRFLRARRELVRPEDAGLPPGGSRRVAGLRREEVARLAGVSTHYYVRLEQGRERHPSAQVVQALARALALEEDATAYLHELARPASGARRPRPRRERVSPNLLRMMAAWPQTPAVVLGRRLTVLAHNDLGKALFDGHAYSGDLVRLVFLDPGIRVTTVSPGVVESELADTITEPGAKEAMRTYRAESIPADAIAAAISYAISQPADVDVNELIIRPAAQR